MATPASGHAAHNTPTVGGAARDHSPWTAVAARLQAATLGEFEIITEIGRGGMAAVYLARDLALNRRVAIKVMSPGLLLGAGMVDRFRQEAITVANLQHAHIVSIHGVRQLEDLHYFVMQFVPGRSLEAVLRDKGALDLDVVRAWLYQVGTALSYAHRRGVIHRDIKPGNILLNADGEAIVTDFGIAKVAESPSHTQTGTVVGTPVYMSPEQCYAKELTGASDQYSLGVVAFEMLAGRPPFSGSSFALMRAHTDEPPPPIRQIRADVPETVEAALDRMLAKRPDARFPHLGEALIALGAGPLSPHDPLHGTLQQLAGASDRLEQLGDLLITPASPIPKTRAPINHSPVNQSPVTPRTPVPATPALVVVMAPPPTDLEPGATASLRATVKNAAGAAVPGTELRWSSSAPDVVSIDSATGTLTAKTPGTATITATAGTAHDSQDVTVGEPRPAHIAVTVDPATLRVGDRATLTAVVTSRFGVVMAPRVEWALDDPGVAAIETVSTSDGPMTLVRAVAAGSVGVVATCDAAHGRGTVRVAAPVVAPPPRPEPPRPIDAATPGSQEPPAAGSRSPDTPATPSGGPGTPHSLPVVPRKPEERRAPPPATATAVLQRLDSPIESPTDPSSLAAPLPRTPAPKSQPPAASPPPAPSPPASAPRTPQTASGPAERVEPGHSDRKRGVWFWALPLVGVAASVAIYAATNRPGPAPTPTDTTALVTPDTPAVPTDTTQKANPTPGVDTLAKVNEPDTSQTDSTPSPPRPAVASRIELRPARPSAVLPGETVTLSATVRDASGAEMPDPVRWSTSDARVATVDPRRGVVRAVAPGETRITARVGTVTSAVTVAVSRPAPDLRAVATVEMAEVRPLTVGETARVTATALNESGSAAQGATIEWSSSNTEVASVSADGVITARGAGSAVIRASAGGRSADRTLTVRARPVVTTDSERPRPPAGKTEAELRVEIQRVLATYVSGIQARDTSLMRRAYPTVSDVLLRRWQTTVFDEAAGPIRIANGQALVLDAPRDAPGVQVRTRYSGRMLFRARRQDQDVPIDFTATVQRDGATWVITNLR